MSTPEEMVVVVPCSGIGKPFGTVSREAAYDLCEELRPKSTRLVALAKLVLGEPGAWGAERAKLLEPEAYFAVMQKQVQEDLKGT